VVVLVVVVGLASGAGLLAGVLAVEWGAWALACPRRRADPAPGEGWESVEVEAADGLVLRGWYLGAGERPAGLLVLVHGLGETGPALLPRAELARGLGWSVLLPDARGFGRSEGSRATFGTRESADLRSWIDQVRDRAGQGAPVVAWGRSMGAAIALGAAAGDERVAGLVLEAPYDDLEAAVARRLGRYRVPGLALLAPAVLRRASRIAGAPLGEPVPLALAPRVGCPVLLLHGGCDVIVPARSAERLENAFGAGARVELLEVAGAGHNDVFERCGPAELECIARLFRQAATS
jgi:alpha-beta hydrolase superfamily lysophospholipase